MESLNRSAASVKLCDLCPQASVGNRARPAEVRLLLSTLHLLDVCRPCGRRLWRMRRDRCLTEQVVSSSRGAVGGLASMFLPCAAHGGSSRWGRSGECHRGLVYLGTLAELGSGEPAVTSRG